jgi:hypothetical protein
MRIEGRWLLCSDGIERPVIDVHLVLPTRQVAALPMLLDTGADFTILAYAAGQSLATYLQPTPASTTAQGIGGQFPTQMLNVGLLFTGTDGRQVMLNGPIPTLAAPANPDLSVLGRDVLDRFELVYSRTRSSITLLTPPDSFTITP